MSSTKDYSTPPPGTRYGRLVVVSCYLRDCGTYRKTSVRCRCDCGHDVDVFLNSLRRLKNPTTSCGCFQRQRVSDTFTTHGESKTPLYRVWATMISRCHNPSVKSFADYGANGIAVCQDWRKYFALFSSWANAHGYASGLEIDRIDYTGNYCPENCRWVSRKTNANNKSSNRYLTFDGKTLTVTQWSELVGIPRTCILARLNRGWPLDQALSLPVEAGKAFKYR